MNPADPRPPSDGASGRTRLILVLSLAWAAVLLFLLFIWPTPWRHPGDREDIRVSRLTGKAEVRDSRSGEWRPARRGWGNGKGTSGGSPVGGGGRSGGEGPGETWWYGEEGETRRGSDGDRWWYRGDGGGEAESGDRGGERRRGGSQIGGGRSGEKRSMGGGGGSPIGGD
jgi:hypothetical protein